MFFGCMLLPDSKETELGSSDQEGSPSAGKNTGTVLVPCHTCGSVSLQVFSMVWIFQGSLGVIFYNIGVLSEGHKNYFKHWYLMSSQPAFLFLTFL